MKKKLEFDKNEIEKIQKFVSEILKKIKIAGYVYPVLKDSYDFCQDWNRGQFFIYHQFNDDIISDIPNKELSLCVGKYSLFSKIYGFENIYKVLNPFLKIYKSANTSTNKTFVAKCKIRDKKYQEFCKRFSIYFKDSSSDSSIRFTIY